MLIDLSDVSAVVTGAGTGIGAATAAGLVACGAKVALIGRRKEKLEEVAAAVQGQTMTVACDVGDRDQVLRVAEQVAAHQGAVAVLVNNAGINTRPRSTADISYEDWDRTIRINLTGAFNWVRAVLPGMRAAGAGTIVNVSSIAGRVATDVAGSAYSASKHGMFSLTTSINEEESRHGIRATAICPGETATPILEQRPEPVSAERRAQMLQAEDVAETVVLAIRLPDRACIRELIIKPRISYL